MTREQKNTTERQSEADAQLAIAAASIAVSTAVRAGARAPHFRLADSTGQKTDLEGFTRSGPVVLHFSRGHWCSFGEHSVKAFAAIHQDVVALGASALAIAPTGTPGAQAREPAIRNLQDTDMRVSYNYGLAFDLPIRLRPSYRRLGYAPPSTIRERGWLVPIQATYLIDRGGLVAFALIDVDYRKRFDFSELLGALKALKIREWRRRGGAYK